MTNKTDIQQTPIDGSLDILTSLELTKRDWLVIFNVLSRQEYRIGDAFLVAPILEKINPIVQEPKTESPDINLGK
jgi:hypothetical protein